MNKNLVEASRGTKMGQCGASYDLANVQSAKALFYGGQRRKSNLSKKLIDQQ